MPISLNNVFVNLNRKSPSIDILYIINVKNQYIFPMLSSCVCVSEQLLHWLVSQFMFCLFYSLCWKIFALSCCLRNRIIHSITGTEYISTMHCTFFLHFILILQTLAVGHIFTEPLLIHYLFYKMLMSNVHCPSKRWIQKFCPLLSLI